MVLIERLEEIKHLWYELELPLRQDLAYVYLEEEQKEIEDIHKKLEVISENRDFREFLSKLHKEHDIKEVYEIEKIFSNKRLKKENPSDWYREAKGGIIRLFRDILPDINAFETFEKNRHEDVAYPNEPHGAFTRTPGNRLISKIKVAIIGAGFSGLATAYFLLMSGKFKGKEIVILEKGKIGSGASGRSAGFLTTSVENDFIDMVEMYGQDVALRYWNAAEEGIELLKEIVKQISPTDKSYFETDTGYLYLANDKEKLETLEEESQALNSIGYQTRILSSEDLSKTYGINGFEGAMHSNKGSFVVSVTFMNYLHRFLLNSGVRIVEHIEVLKVENNRFPPYPSLVVTSKGRLTAEKVVIAANHQVVKLGYLKNKVFSAETYLALTEKIPTDFLAKHEILKHQLMWDSDEIYTYFRVLRNGRILIGGNDVMIKKSDYQLKGELEFMHHFYEYLVSHFPQLKGIRFDGQWSGVLAGTPDMFPYIGKVPNSEAYLAISNGIPYCILCGKIITQLMLTGKSDYDDLFGLERKTKGTVISTALKLGPGIFTRAANMAIGILKRR